ncbi:two-component sensor histidine kinase [Actinomyces viscosus]|nr:two-component sensor histidine kinase [Actinomyces viscosus]
MSVPGYPPAPASTPPAPGWGGGPSGGPGGGSSAGRAAPAPAPGTSIPQRHPPYPAYSGYAGYPGYSGYPPYSTQPAYAAYPPPPATAAGSDPRYYQAPTPPYGAAPVAAAVPPAPAPALSPSQRRALEITLAVLRSVGLFALCLLGSLTSLGSQIGHEEALKQTGNGPIVITSFLIGLVLLVAVFLRRRWPVPITVASALAGMALYLDTTVGLIAFTTVVRRARSLRDPMPWATGTLLAVGTLVALARDASHGSTGNSMIGIVISGSSDSHDPHVITHVPAELVLFLAVVAMALPIAVGLWLRARDGEKEARRRAQEAADASARAERAAEEQTRTSTRLADTVSLQAERERVAREVHDGLGHRLSLLALHASALERGVLSTSESPGASSPAEASDEDDPRAAAQRVREEAQGAMRDLRSLLAVLREPVGAAEPAPRLEDLKEVVDGVLAAHQQLSSSIYLDRAAEADEVLSRAVYRIVQESLTNARKHSPGTSVQLRVEGGPDTGIDITCSNRIPRREPVSGQDAHSPGTCEEPRADDVGAGSGTGTDLPPGDARGGSGLRGMARRAEICGGTFHAGPDGHGRFVVSAHLPWRSAVSPQNGH